MSTAIEMSRWAVVGCPGWWPSEMALVHFLWSGDWASLTFGMMVFV
jgi:hypothetical protein